MGRMAPGRGGGWGGLGIMSGPGAYTRNYEHYPTKQNCIKRIYYDFTIYRKGASSRRHLHYYIPCLSVTLHHRENMKKKGKCKGRHFPIFLYLTLLSQGRGLQAGPKMRVWHLIRFLHIYSTVRLDLKICTVLEGNFFWWIRLRNKTGFIIILYRYWKIAS